MEQLNPGQIKKNIKQLKQRQEQYLYYLGQLAFQAGEEGKLQEAGMLEAYGILKDVQVQMAQGEASLEQIRAAKEAAQNPRCPQCGGSLPRGAAFCASCGANLAALSSAAPPAAPVPAGRLCASCGTPLDDDAVFCGNCGARSDGSAMAGAAPMPSLQETHACPKCGAGIPDKDMVFCSSCAAKEEPMPTPEETRAVPPAPVEATPEETRAAPPAPVEATPVEAAVEAPPAPAVQEAVPPLEETLACPKCGADVPEKDIIFCSACGTKVRE